MTINKEAKAAASYNDGRLVSLAMLTPGTLERFAALVAAKAAAAERETCARFALINGKDAPTQEERDMAWAIAAAIRARSKP